MKMRINGIILVIQVIEVHSVSKIVAPKEDHERIAVAAVNIIDRCFGSPERWSELLIVPSHSFHRILKKIHDKSKTSNSIAFPDRGNEDELKQFGKFNEYLNTGAGWQETKPNAVLVATDSLQHLESVLGYLKHEARRIWRPRSYFIIVLETECELATCNNMFKVVWKYWILNAVVVCSSNNPPDQNKSGIRLYTFNPYSADHSPHWKSVIHELVEVSVHPRNFNHSWYIFEQRYAEIISSEDCGDLFFDKTSNLNGYMIPSSFENPEFLTNKIKSGLAKLFTADSRVLRTLSQALQFKLTQVPYRSVNDYGQRFENGSYSGMANDIYTERSHLAATRRKLKIYFGVGFIYPHETSSHCFISHIVGNRPQWTNLADAKHIWIALGFGLIFSTVVLYLQNKSLGITAAFFEAQRLIIGSSIIRTSAISKHRIILGSIFLVVLVIDGAIRGRFISILTVARSYPNLDSLEQLKERDIDISGPVVMKNSIPDPEIKSRYNSSLQVTECVKSLRNNERNRVCFSECRTAQLLILNSSNLHLSPSVTASYYVTFLTTMYWPMKNRYNSGVQRLVEAGIYEKFNSDTYREFEVESWKFNRAAEPPTFKATELNDLLPAFVLLFVGLLVGLMVFAWEMIVMKEDIHSLR